MQPGVLFICLGNSCRSIMAEALARHYLGPSVRVESAGLNPLGHVVSETLQVLAELGLEVQGLHSKGLWEVNPRDYSLVVNLTSHALAPYLPPDCRRRVIHRPVPDPYGGPLEEYRATRDRIRELILTEIAPLLQSP